jgi:type IV pilus assembly protein PilE
MLLTPGFSLLELIITLMLIAIMISFALPSYRHPIVKAQQVTAKLALYDLAQELESYYGLNKSYEHVRLEDLGISSKVEGTDYILRIVAKGKTTFLIAAKSLKPETYCGDFLLDEMGKKSITGKGSVEECW